MTGEMFLAYVSFLVPTLRRNDIVVMDNCRVHLGTGIEKRDYRNSGRDTALPAEIFARPQSHRDALQQIGYSCVRWQRANYIIPKP